MRVAASTAALSDDELRARAANLERSLARLEPVGPAADAIRCQLDATRREIDRRAATKDP